MSLGGVCAFCGGPGDEELGPLVGEAHPRCLEEARTEEAEDRALEEAMEAQEWSDAMAEQDAHQVGG